MHLVFRWPSDFYSKSAGGRSAGGAWRQPDGPEDRSGSGTVQLIEGRQASVVLHVKPSPLSIDLFTGNAH
ncbi:hypothetical protein D9M71_798530 [compost metagenome]